MPRRKRKAEDEHEEIEPPTAKKSSGEVGGKKPVIGFFLYCQHHRAETAKMLESKGRKTTKIAKVRLPPLASLRVQSTHSGPKSSWPVASSPTSECT